MQSQDNKPPAARKCPMLWFAWHGLLGRLCNICEGAKASIQGWQGLGLFLDPVSVWHSTGAAVDTSLALQVPQQGLVDSAPLALVESLWALLLINSTMLPRLRQEHHLTPLVRRLTTHVVCRNRVPEHCQQQSGSRLFLDVVRQRTYFCMYLP